MDEDCGDSCSDVSTDVGGDSSSVDVSADASSSITDSGWDSSDSSLDSSDSGDISESIPEDPPPDDSFTGDDLSGADDSSAGGEELPSEDDSGSDISDSPNEPLPDDDGAFDGGGGVDLNADEPLEENSDMDFSVQHTEVPSDDVLAEGQVETDEAGEEGAGDVSVLETDEQASEANVAEPTEALAAEELEESELETLTETDESGTDHEVEEQSKAEELKELTEDCEEDASAEVQAQSDGQEAEDRAAEQEAEQQAETEEQAAEQEAEQQAEAEDRAAEQEAEQQAEAIAETETAELTAEAEANMDASGWNAEVGEVNWEPMDQDPPTDDPSLTDVEVKGPEGPIDMNGPNFSDLKLEKGHFEFADVEANRSMEYGDKIYESTSENAVTDVENPVTHGDGTSDTLGAAGAMLSARETSQDLQNINDDAMDAREMLVAGGHKADYTEDYDQLIKEQNTPDPEVGASADITQGSRGLRGVLGSASDAGAGKDVSDSGSGGSGDLRDILRKGSDPGMDDNDRTDQRDAVAFAALKKQQRDD